MAHFRGTIDGGRGQASRLGTKNSGLKTACNGWNLGGTCELVHNAAKGRDEVVITLTDGSGKQGIKKELGRFIMDGDKFKQV